MTSAAITDNVRVVSLDSKSATLFFLTGVDKDQVQEYSVDGAEIDDGIQKGNVPIEAITQGGKLISLKFPPGNEIETISKIDGPKEPEKEISGEVSLLVESAIKIGGEIYHINGVDVNEIKVGYDVKAVVSGDYLVSIVHTPKPKEPKKGGGKIVSICFAPLELTYEYSYTPPGEEKKTNRCSFNAFSLDAVEQMKQFKVGDNVSVTYSQQGKTKKLETIGKKQFSSKNTVVNIDISPIAGAILATYAHQNKLTDEQKGILLSDAISFSKVILEQMTKEVKN
jgi:hypothetical protein